MSNDPRVFFAAERTLLAWLRSGIAVIGLGFLVARFGLFVALVRHDTQLQSMLESTPAATPTGSTFIGTAFVIAGALIIGVATAQHSRFIKTLGPADLPPRYWSQFSIVVSSVLAGLSAALGIYLLLT